MLEIISNHLLWQNLSRQSKQEAAHRAHEKNFGFQRFHNVELGGLTLVSFMATVGVSSFISMFALSQVCSP